MLSYSMLDANVVDVEKRRNPSKHYVSTEDSVWLAASMLSCADAEAASCPSSMSVILEDFGDLAIGFMHRARGHEK